MAAITIEASDRRFLACSAGSGPTVPAAWQPRFVLGRGLEEDRPRGARILSWGCARTPNRQDSAHCVPLVQDSRQGRFQGSLNSSAREESRRGWRLWYPCPRAEQTATILSFRLATKYARKLAEWSPYGHLPNWMTSEWTPGLTPRARKLTFRSCCRRTRDSGIMLDYSVKSGTMGYPAERYGSLQLSTICKGRA